jgi:hypothetical protein
MGPALLIPQPEWLRRVHHRVYGRRHEYAASSRRPREAPKAQLPRYATDHEVTPPYVLLRLSMICTGGIHRQIRNYSLAPFEWCD